ncbi:acid-sensing ion channel 4-A-like [Penaeus chinensis]|uniref:acid-sensing ion channel 4-A-like n=1 Tax=Penaeus chinensis TaxID=139456 RepID=UPI001FB738E5|nr:acid-sensing ion channel 4-A-like [Penaeus chinensis]
MSSEECCSTFLTPTITPSGICFWGNFTPTFDQTMETAQTGLSLMLNAPKATETFDWTIVEDDFFPTSSGLTLSLLSNVTQPSLHISEALPVGGGAHVSVAVDYSVMDNRGLTKDIWPWSQPTCVSISSPRPQLLNTTENCVSSNIFSSLVRYGKCLPLLVSEDYFPGTDKLGPCLIDNMLAVPAKSSGTLPPCPEICHAEEFRSRVVSAPLKAGFSSRSAGRSQGLFSQVVSSRRNSSGRDFDNLTVSVVTVYYPSLTYREIIQSKPNLEMWFSSIGGHIGICIGASVISAIEILCFVATVCFLVFKKFVKTLCSC